MGTHASSGHRIAVEAAIAAAIAFALSLIVFGPLLGRLDVGWAGGDMLTTYVNSAAWSGFSYGDTTQFGFPLGMNLNYFPGIDITENTFALIVNAVTGSTFLGINLLVLLSFPLVAALAYLVIRMTGLQGPLAISLAVAFTFIPYHWGRALGHTYLSTLYSAVVGLALVLLVSSGPSSGSGATDRVDAAWSLLAVAVMVVVVAWTGVYYVVFTLILGVFALLWRLAHRARWTAIGLDAIPFVGVAVLAVIGFLPSLLRPRRPAAGLARRADGQRVGHLRGQPRHGDPADPAELPPTHGLLQRGGPARIRGRAVRREQRHHQLRDVGHRPRPADDGGRLGRAHAPTPQPDSGLPSSSAWSPT